MIVPNILFKVISNDPINKSMVVKFCRENAPKAIDNYKSYNISYYNLDFTSPEKLIHSIYLVGRYVVKEQLEQEPVLDENQSESINSVDLSDYVGKVVSMNCDEQMSAWSRGVYELWDEITL